MAAMAKTIVNHMADEVGPDKMTLLLTEMEGLSAEEVQQQLAEPEELDSQERA